jgi:hypothetical protein
MALPISPDIIFSSEVCGATLKLTEEAPFIIKNILKFTFNEYF